MGGELDFAIDLKSVRDRLTELGYFMSVTDIRTATEAIQEISAQPPSAFVSVASETAADDRFIRGTGGPSQQVTVDISTLFAEPVARMDNAADDMVELTRKAIIRQLLGWTPIGAARHLVYSRYLLRGMSGGVIWGEVIMRTEYRLEPSA